MADRKINLETEEELIELDMEEEDLELEPEDDDVVARRLLLGIKDSEPEHTSDKKEALVVKRRHSSEMDMLDPEDTGKARKKSDKSPKATDSKRKSKFWIGFAIYGGVLLVLAVIFLIYTNSCLVRYENAQPGNYVNRYLETFEKKIEDKSIKDDLELPAGKFESADAYMETYLSQFQGDVTYSAKKSATSYATESPVYDVYAGEDVVAHITLKVTDTKTIFAILTIMDWEIDSIEPVCNKDTFNYVIKAPQNYTVKINDVELGEDERTDKVTENPNFVYVSEYVDMPSVVEYKVEGFINEPSIKIYDAAGNEVSYEKDDSGNIDASNSIADVEIPKEYYDLAFNMAKMWSNFTTKDLTGGKYGLDTIRQYLIKDSYYWNMATDYAGGVDITFVSAHTLKADAFRNIKISEYVSYGENCFSCHVYFDKAMQLTKTGATVIETMDSTFYFVKYDDSDDGVDNPHWAIVDMIATTE